MEAALKALALGLVLACAAPQSTVARCPELPWMAEVGENRRSVRFVEQGGARQSIDVGWNLYAPARASYLRVDSPWTDVAAFETPESLRDAALRDLDALAAHIHAEADAGHLKKSVQVDNDVLDEQPLEGVELAAYLAGADAELAHRREQIAAHYGELHAALRAALTPPCARP